MVETKLRDLIVEKYGSVLEFSKHVGLSNSTIASIISRGVPKAGIANILRICEELGISAEELSNGNIVFVTKAKKEIPSLEDQVDYIRRADLTLGGQILTDSEKATVTDALNFAISMIRRNRSEK